MIFKVQKSQQYINILSYMLLKVNTLVLFRLYFGSFLCYHSKKHRAFCQKAERTISNMNLDDFQGYIFDLDGTLIDSSHAWKRVDDIFLSSYGIETPDDYDKEIAGMGFELAAQYTIDRFSLEKTVNEVMDEWNNIVKDIYATEVFLFDGVKEYLRYLKNKGRKLGIATVNNLDLTESVLSNNGVLDLFDNITTSAEVSKPKGFPDIYLKSSEKLRIPVSKCVVFEDILQGIKGANDGGFKTVAVMCKKEVHYRNEIMSLCDKYISSYSELLDSLILC